MFIAVKITEGLIKKVKKRRDHFSGKFREFENAKKGTLFGWARNKKNPYKERFDFYDAFPVGKLFGHNLDVGDAVYLSPKDADRLFGFVYDFEITAAHIPVDKIVADTVSADKISPGFGKRFQNS